MCDVGVDSWVEAIYRRDAAAKGSGAFELTTFHRVWERWCCKTLWCCLLSSWFFIVHLSVICTYQMHAATIEHRKNNRNNHKSVRIKETEKCFDQVIHQSCLICLHQSSFIKSHIDCTIHPRTPPPRTPLHNECAAGGNLHCTRTFTFTRTINIPSNTKCTMFNVHRTCSDYIVVLLVFCSFSVRVQ